MEKKDKDRVLVGPKVGEDSHLFVRMSSEEVAVGVLTEGVQPNSDSLLELKHVQGCEYEVKNEVRYTARGPAQVSTKAYRSGWDTVFGGLTPVGVA